MESRSLLTGSIVAGTLGTSLGARHHDGRIAILFGQLRDEFPTEHLGRRIARTLRLAGLEEGLFHVDHQQAAPSTSGTAEGSGTAGGSGTAVDSRAAAGSGTTEGSDTTGAPFGLKFREQLVDLRAARRGCREGSGEEGAPSALYRRRAIAPRVRSTQL